MGRKPLVQGDGGRMRDESLVDIGNDTDSQPCTDKAQKDHTKKGPAIMGKNHFQ